MDIVKLSEICEIINGKDLHANIPLGKIISTQRTKMPYVKTSCFSNGFQSEPTYYVKNEYIDDINVPKLIVNKDDLVISKACSVGEPNFIVLNNTSITRALTQLKPNKNFILKKYLYYYLIKNNNYFKSHSSGTTIKHFSLKILNDFPISLINLKSQQSIIDIIEPKEKLFLKFKNLVRIDNIENCKNDMKDLIDIIEPFDLEMSIRIKKNNLYLKFIKNSFFANENKKLFLSDIIIPTKDAKIENCNEVIDLSSINGDSVTFFNFKKTNNFSSNIFSTRENDIFISSIRPNLKKYGITTENKNILGTLFNFRPINQIDRGFILYCLSSNDFQNFLIQISEGTKMPIIKWKKFKDYEFLSASINEKNVLNIFFDLIKNNNKILKILEEIKINLIEIFIK